MNPQEPADYNPHQHVTNELTALQPGEELICNLKRHPIGLITIYVMCAIVLTIIAILAFTVVPHYVDSSTSGSATRIGSIIFLLAAIICTIYLLIANKIYWGNKWIVTSDSITQVTQSSLFDRQSSQLSLHSLEDVTAEQNGILTHMFGYGVLKVETAGERSKFQFLYCPNPNFYAQRILQAREAFIQGNHQPTPPAYQEQADTYRQP